LHGIDLHLDKHQRERILKQHYSVQKKKPGSFEETDSSSHELLFKGHNEDSEK